jgi:chitin disaccharide deacetylase
VTQQHSIEDMLIVNADDWGRNTTSTDNSMVCFKNGRITSVSAMVFMEDSKRAAALALEHGLDAGLHLNFTTKFNQSITSSKLVECQQRIAAFLQKNKYYFLLYNPVLKTDFRYVFSAQYEEYSRLYHQKPTHIDGHHHMHLCTNVLFQRLLPRGSKVRRNFSFTSKEKGTVNRSYRFLLDRWLQRSYQCTDFFFSIVPMHTSHRLRGIVELASAHNVELMVHPEKQDEYNYLLSTEYVEMIRDKKIGSYRIL